MLMLTRRQCLRQRTARVHALRLRPPLGNGGQARRGRGRGRGRGHVPSGGGISTLGGSSGGGAGGGAGGVAGRGRGWRPTGRRARAQWEGCALTGSWSTGAAAAAAAGAAAAAVYH